MKMHTSHFQVKVLLDDGTFLYIFPQKRAYSIFFIASLMSFTSTVSLSESRVSSSPLSGLSVVEQCGGTVLLEQLKSYGGTVEQW